MALALLLAGALFALVGTALVSIPAAIIVAGVFLMASAVALAAIEDRKAPAE